MNETAIERSRATIARHGKSFALASRLFPRGVADEAAVIYAWCRRADDAVDLVAPERQLAAVRFLSAELDGIYRREAQADPVLSEFQAVVSRRGIPRDYPELMLRGMERDASGVTYATYEDLLSYCFQVAGTVGLMMSHVMGVRHDAALRHAAHLGMAMQITNVCRDVREDWERGRLYLPSDLLERYGAPALHADGRPLPHEARVPMARTITDLLGRAEALYASGDQGLPYLSPRAAVAVRAARLIYADIGRVILARGADPFAPRAVVSTPRKLWLAARACFSVWRVAPSFNPVELPHAIGFRDVVSG